MPDNSVHPFTAPAMRPRTQTRLKLSNLHDAGNPIGSWKTFTSLVAASEVLPVLQREERPGREDLP
jgi:hypothetical protein